MRSDRDARQTALRTPVAKIGVGRLPIACLSTDPHVFRTRTVTRLAVDAGLRPLAVIRVRLGVVVDRELAHVAVPAGRVEREQRIRPCDGSVGVPDGVTDHAGRGVVPALRPDVVRDGQDLEPAALEGSQEEEHVLARIKENKIVHND